MIDKCKETATGSHNAGVQIQSYKRNYIFPWSQLIFAEGDADEIRIAFSTHDVVISGGNLNTLLADITSQRLNLLRESVRAEIFAFSTEPQITRISIKKVE